MSTEAAPEIEAPAAADGPVTIAALHSGAHVASYTVRVSLWRAAPAALQAEPTPHAAAMAAAAVLGVLEIYSDSASFHAVELATAALARVQESDAGAAFAKALVLCLRARTAGGDAAGAAGLTDLGYAQALRLLCVAQRGSFATLCGTADKAADGFEELAALQARGWPATLHLQPCPRAQPRPCASPILRPEPDRAKPLPPGATAAFRHLRGLRHLAPRRAHTLRQDGGELSLALSLGLGPSLTLALTLALTLRVPLTRWAACS